MERNIIYHLDGGSNDPDNPATYVESLAGADLLPATKENYNFAGWHTDEGFGTQVISITADWSVDINLYAKFTPKSYNITYDTDGGSNGEGNLSSYTYGVGVPSLAPAEKTGYIKQLSLYDTGVTAEYGDEFVTLSCCSYHVEDGRFVVVGRRKRD